MKLKDMIKTGKNNLTVRENNNTKKYLHFTYLCLSCSGIVLTFAVVLFYILFPARGEFHADCTDTLMWAVASFESGHIISNTFKYACFLPFGGQLLMLPFIGIFGVSLATHIIGMCLFLVIFSAALIMLTRAMKFNCVWTFTAFFSLMMTVSTSEKLREIFWGHIIYYSLGILFLMIGLGIIFKILDKSQDIQKNKKKLIIHCAVMFIWFTLCSANQLESFTIFVVPAAAGVLGEAFFSYSKIKSRDNIFSVLVFVIIAFAAGTGYLLGELVIGNNVAGYASAYSTFSEITKWNDNIQTFFTAWLSLIGVTTEPYQPLADVRGLLTLIRIIYGLILLAAPVIITFKYKKQSRPVKILIISHWTMTALIMMGYIFGLLSAANWRLSPIICTSVLLTVALCEWTFTKTSYKRNIAIILIPMMIICSASAAGILRMQNKKRANESLYKLIDTLEENDLTYGYATFWNANSVTVLSDDKVKVRSISVDDNGICTQSLYQSDKNWYKDQPGQDVYFVVLAPNEINKVNDNNAEFINSAVGTIKSGSYTIAVFDHNIF